MDIQMEIVEKKVIMRNSSQNNDASSVYINGNMGNFYPGKGAAAPDRCAGIEFDAIAPNENGDTFFFKGMAHYTSHFVWWYSPCFRYFFLQRANPFIQIKQCFIN